MVCYICLIVVFWDVGRGIYFFVVMVVFFCFRISFACASSICRVSMASSLSG